jgi:hypothetical protein
MPTGQLGAQGSILMPPELKQVLSQVQDPSAAGNILGLAAVRQALFDVLGAYPAANVLPYFYSFELSSRNGDAVAANSTGNASIKVTADSAFIAMAAVGASKGSYLLDMRIDASDRQLNNRAVHSVAAVGTAERPGRLWKPLLLPANSTVSFTVTDLSGEDNDIFYTLTGFKIYGYTPDA